MEEKEVSFYIEKDKDYLEISSNIDENLDYIDSEEIIALIIELLNYEIEKEVKNVLMEEVTDKKLDKKKYLECSNIINERVANFTGNLIHLILNFIHNQDKTKETDKIDELDYSLIVYGPTENKKHKEVYESFYYSNVKADEKALACYILYKDIAEDLLKNNNSKKKVKEAIYKSTFINLYKINKYIDDYNI